MCDTYDITYSDLNPTLYFAGKRTVTESNFSHTHDAPELFTADDLVIWQSGWMELPLHLQPVILSVYRRTYRTVHCRQCMITLQFYSLLHFQTSTLKGMEPNCLDFPGGSSVLHTDGLVRQDITNLCLRMISERYSNQVGQYFMQKAYLTQLLMTIIRQITVPPKQTFFRIFVVD